MKVALLGTGFGQAHAAAYAARGDVDVVIYGRTPAKLDNLADQFGFPTTTDLDSLYADPSIDLIDICLPTALHAEHVLCGLEAGKHVLTELPLALSMDDAHRVADAAAGSDRHVFVHMYARFSPTTTLLLDAVRQGTYGRMAELEIWLHTALLWPGYELGLDTIVMDMLHGELDALVQTLGLPEKTTTTAIAGGERGSAVHASFTYPNAVARVSGSSLMPMPYGSRGGYRATFTGGVLEYAFTAGYTGQPAAPVVVEYTEQGRKELTPDADEPYTAAMIDHVLACLRGQASNENSPTSVLDSLRLTLEVHQAVNR